ALERAERIPRAQRAACSRDRGVHRLIFPVAVVTPTPLRRALLPVLRKGWALPPATGVLTLPDATRKDETMNAPRIEGAVALVTGANRGIGRALTEALLS